MYSFVLLAIQKKQQSPKPLVKVAQDFSFHCPYVRMQLSKHNGPLDVGPMLRADFLGVYLVYWARASRLMLAPSPSVVAASAQQMECSTPHTPKVQMRLKYKYELYNG